MSSPRYRWAIALGLTLAPFAGAAWGQYHFERFDIPQLGSAVSPNGINDAGDIVGRPGFLWIKGTYSKLELDRTGAVSSVGAEGISNNGLIVGSYFVNDPPGSTTFSSSFLRYTTGHHADLSIMAYGVNSLGWAVGDCAGQPSCAFRLPAPGAYLWQPSSTPQGIYTLIGNPNNSESETDARDINDAGLIVGFTLRYAGGATGFVTSAANPAGDLQEIAYPGARDTQIFGVNNSGDITGVYDRSKGFVRTAHGEFIDLGEGVYPEDINDHGIVVGSYDVGDFQLAGFIATPAIPEPRTWTAILIGAVCLCLFRCVTQRQTPKLPARSSDLLTFNSVWRWRPSRASRRHPLPTA